jgi:hypothetical protein
MIKIIFLKKIYKKFIINFNCRMINETFENNMNSKMHHILQMEISSFANQMVCY